MSIAVLVPGLLTTVQDGGRHGHAAIGVGVSGPMDAVALRVANILVGNPQDAAALEITLRGPRLRCNADCTLAVTGAPLAIACNGSTLPMWQPVLIRAGAELAFGSTRQGTRSYIAFAGGIRTPALLGSRSVDVNAGIGRVLAAGDVFPVGTPTYEVVPAKWSLDPAPWFDADTAQPIRVIAGAHFSRLDTTSQRNLFEAELRIAADSNRVGYRFDGAKLALREPLELVSAGVVPGTVQLPPGGAPIALMAEAPTTGGYPRIAHVIAVDLPRLAQRRPGAAVRFTQVSPELAQTLLLERERALARIARTVTERLHGKH
jgi:antagonist of KipI